MTIEDCEKEIAKAVRTFFGIERHGSCALDLTFHSGWFSQWLKERVL